MEQSDPNQTSRDVVGLNHALVDELKKMGCIQTPRVEAAFRAVLRHQFLPGAPLDQVYSNEVVLTKQDQGGQWISSSSQPAIMAIMLEQLNLDPGDKVLEIGAGTGYNAALMAHIVGKSGQVVTVDLDVDLVEAAREHLTRAGFKHVQVVCTDGGYGYADAAPFDRIILTVGAPDIVPAWRDQLKPEGRLVLPLMLKGSMESIAFEPAGDHLVSRSVKDCGFMPLRGDFASNLVKEVQLGPDPNLYVETMGELPIEPDAAYRLLIDGGKDSPVNVEVHAWQVLAGHLWTWLSFHESDLCKLVARDEMVSRAIVPPLIAIDGKPKSAGTVLLPGKTGMAALMRPPGQQVPLLPLDKAFRSDQPFPLFVRRFGPDDSIGQRFVNQIQAWDAAGRPSTDSMRIRAYPKDSMREPAVGEFVIERPWTRLMIEWPESGTGNLF
jgi:protein-L-isoaspartate(D-aspartate) O-methyltransferase